MRAIWKGSISFSLVNIPIALYPATRNEELRFRLLRAKDLSPVNYKRVAEADGKEVPWDIWLGQELFVIRILSLSSSLDICHSSLDICHSSFS